MPQQPQLDMVPKMVVRERLLKMLFLILILMASAISASHDGSPGIQLPLAMADNATCTPMRFMNASAAAQSDIYVQSYALNHRTTFDGKTKGSQASNSLRLGYEHHDAVSLRLTGGSAVPPQERIGPWAISSVRVDPRVHVCGAHLRGVRLLLAQGRLFLKHNPCGPVVHYPVLE